jgi:ubiquinone/menaquinone biosynthesis C-methylase UbiE
MEFFDLVNISERFMELVNPSTPEKVITFGKFLRLREGSRVIDFGCGYAEPLVLWAEHFGIVGTGIDVREQVCERARRKVSERGLSDRIEIVCARGADYVFEEKTFDAATCVGASFVWGGYRQTIGAMKKAIQPEGRLGIGEPYWLRDNVPATYAARENSIHNESELLQIAREEGFDFEYVVRASHDDWDRYEADNWHGLIRWIEENPDHPEREEVIRHLHKIQDEYLVYGREYLGWAMYVLAPQLYR